MLERLEIACRRQVAISHAGVAKLGRFSGCPPVRIALADVWSTASGVTGSLRISRTEASRRIRCAEQLAPRRTLTGAGEHLSVGRLIADPGVCSPGNPALTTSDEVQERVRRSCGQRQHDALKALVRGQLGDPKFVQHNGLPVTAIATATVQDLQAGTGHAVTAGGWRERGQHSRKLMCPNRFHLIEQELNMPALSSIDHRVVIAIDPHKPSDTPRSCP
nr:DUF222 domain-containing protein [Mycolicibacterium sarraceniae]